MAPQNVGIKAIEIYIPNICVDQSELEKFDGVSPGKYTIGLGQTKMSFCNDREDIYSITLTVLSSLLAKYHISPASIGRLEVGTETLLDKSKSVKSVLMQLFPGNSNIEGIDTINACYGGTNALFNAVNWIESSSWDGRDAIVVCGDIAVYAEGAARPTGGAGSVAMLVGPDAVLELGKIKGSYFEHVYDFFKPDLRSEYPVVEGRYSLECYTRALDGCYEAYRRREEVLRRQREHDEAAEGIRENGWKVNGTNGVNGVHEINGASGTNGVNGSNGFHKTNRASGPNGADGVYETNGLNSVDGINGAGNTNGIHKSNGINGINGDNSTPTTTVPLLITDRFSYMAFHSPTSKLVTKSYARLSYADYLTSPTHPTFCALDPSLTSIPYTESLIDRRVEKTFLSLTSSDFATHVKPAMTCPTMCGNMYTASLYSGLCSLLSNVEPETLKAKTVGMYSYGSGMASTLFSVRVIGDTAEMREKMNLHERLGKRVVTSPEGFDEAMKLREAIHLQKDFTPTGSTTHLVPGTYYLTGIEGWKRTYAIA